MYDSCLIQRTYVIYWKESCVLKSVCQMEGHTIVSVNQALLLWLMERHANKLI